MSERWITLFEVSPIDRTDPELEGIAGAIVHVVGLAEEAVTFMSLARETLRDSGFEPITAEEPELVDTRKTHGSMSRELQELANAVTEAHPIEFGDFHSWGH